LSRISFIPIRRTGTPRADRELDNFRGALDCALTDEKIDFGMRIVNGLHRYWVARVYWMEATGWLQRLLALADAGDPRRCMRKQRSSRGTSRTTTIPPRPSASARGACRCRARSATSRAW
jgi:hypothetical protein